MINDMMSSAPLTVVVGTNDDDDDDTIAVVNAMLLEICGLQSLLDSQTTIINTKEEMRISQATIVNRPYTNLVASVQISLAGSVENVVTRSNVLEECREDRNPNPGYDQEGHPCLPSTTSVRIQVCRPDTSGKRSTWSGWSCRAAKERTNTR